MADRKKLPENLQSPPTSPPQREPDAIADAPYGVLPTACQYCVVGCGYEAHLWEKSEGTDDPPNLEQAHWVSPAMSGLVQYNGRDKIAAVTPDPKCSMNKGNHSPRGGSQGRNLVDARGPAAAEDTNRERLTSAYLRTQNGFEPIATDDAVEILAELVKTATKWNKSGNQIRFDHPGGLGVKLYEYQFLENTYAATKLFYQLIGSPNIAYHDRPSVASNTQGFNDSGINPHGYRYDDIWDSDVLLLAGNNPYENHSVFFMQYMAGKRIIVLDPRRTITADYAEKTGGLHLQPNVLGADTLVLNALARYIRDQQRQNTVEWPSRLPHELIATTPELDRFRQEAGQADPDDGPKKPRLARYQLSVEEFFDFLDQPGNDGQPLYTLERVEKVAGISVDRLKKAADMLAGPVDDLPTPDVRKVSLIFEKGLIWGYSYQNTAAFANLGLLLGSVLRPSADNPDGESDNVLGVTGRAGDTKRGGRRCVMHCRMTPSQHAAILFHNASDRFVAEDGTSFRTHHNFDVHLVGTDVAPLHPRARAEHPEDIRLLWIIGSNAAGQMGNAQAKWAYIQQRRIEHNASPESTDPGVAKDKLIERIRAGGLVVVQQDIYPNPTTQYADLILPAKGWGEEDFTRYTGERRLRLYSRFQDAPSDQCRPDWQIFKAVADALLPDQDDAQVNGLTRTELNGWASSAHVFRDMAHQSNWAGWLRDVEGEDPNAEPQGHTWLRQQGTEGAILPLKRDETNGNFQHFYRVPVAQRKFSDGTPFGPYAFIRADWKEIEPDFVANQRGEDEFYICNGRVNELWNSMFTHIRNETVRQRWPDNMPGPVIELNPDDAREIQDDQGNVVGVRNGDVVEIQASDIHLGARQGFFKAVVSMQPNTLPRRVAFAIFSYPAMQQRLDTFPYRDFATDGYVNNITTGYIDPINPIAAVKYACGKIVATGQRYPEDAAVVVSPPYIGPTYRPRNVAVVQPPMGTTKQRIDWKMRELIVQKGLVRARAHSSDERSESFRSPDRLLQYLHGIPDTFAGLLSDVMRWPTEGIPLDGWADPQLSFVADTWAPEFSQGEDNGSNLTERMRALIQSKQAIAQFFHAAVPTDGQTLQQLFEQEQYDAILTFLLNGVAVKPPFVGKRLVEPQDPQESALYLHITDPVGAMSGRFEVDEIELIKQWIMSLDSGGSESLSFERDIKPLFTPGDRACMLSRFDLSDYQDVRTHSRDIALSLRGAEGRLLMPIGNPWPEDQIQRFERWIAEGFPP